MNYHIRPLVFAKSLTRLMVAGALCLLAAAAAFVVWNVRTQMGEPILRFDTSRANVVQQIRQLNRLESASYTVDKVVEAGTQGNRLQQLFYGDRILLMAQGEVVAGFDLSRLDERAITASGEALTVRLPRPEILFVKLDNRETRVYDRRMGLFSKGNRHLEAQARQKAEQSIQQGALEAGILGEAARSAQSQLAPLLRHAGFRTVTVQVEG